MSNTLKKPFAAAIGAAVIGTLSLGGTAMAAENPFGLKEMDHGYMQMAEGKCGGEKKAEEAKCGGEKKTSEGKCGEGKCGGEKKPAEGKCGEAKCGGKK